MKIAFTSNLRLSKSNVQLLDTINEILDDYIDQGYVLTLRQLYYQLVSKDIIPNNDKEYAKISTILKKGRMAGIVDWSAIEDRVRIPKIPYWVADVDDALNDTISQYRLNRMRDQSTYIEVWVEKDALSSVLSRITNKYHIRLMVNRGYSSVSAIYESYKRFRYNPNPTIIYLGDHDPSGMDMIRDVRERLLEFGVEVDVRPIALTMEQIKKFNPPPNPAKITDPRAKWYIEKYGEISWELDALPPSEINRVLEDEILSLIDYEKYEYMIEQEKADITKIKSILNK